MITLSYPRRLALSTSGLTLTMMLTTVAAHGQVSAPQPAAPTTIQSPPNPLRDTRGGGGQRSVDPGAGGGAAASPRTSVQSGASRPISEDYVIGSGDVLQISVWKNETLSRVLPVRPDGKISVPLLQDVQASGLTTIQLRDEIVKGLTEFIANPEVSVNVAEVRSMRVSVLGEVLRPGVLELRGAMTILEAIAMAGGLRDFASPSRIMVIRTDGDGRVEKFRFNYNRAVSSGGTEDNLLLRPGDVVVVP